MNDKKLEKAANDKELAANEVYKKSISASDNIDNINEQDKRKLDIRDAEQPITSGISADKSSTKTPKGKRRKAVSLILAVTPLIILAAMIYFLSSPYGQNLINSGIPLPEVTIEKVEFHQNQVVAFIRNTGPEQVTISQADINDRIQSAAIEPSQVLPRLSEAKVIIPFLWNP
ncbi:MAG TPA: hypothetical protein VJP58_07610, partial [Candidatus Nitrosocosmicus sp.]|nr:hypothetical protein [Candidatus Nitrosocosmicus sp.]